MRNPPGPLREFVTTFEGYRPWQDEEHLRELYHGRGMTIQEIADVLDTSYPTVHKWLDKFDIERESFGEHQTPEILKDADWLRKQHHDLGRSMTDIAEEVGCSQSAVSGALERRGIEKRPSRRVDDDSKQVLRSKELLQTLYEDETLSAGRIADQLGCDYSTVWFWLDRHGIERRAVEEYTGPDHGRWQGGYEIEYGGALWKSRRNERRELDGYECQRCGIAEADYHDRTGRGLDVHHIRPVNDFDDPEDAHELTNLITLCRQCHAVLEGVPIDNGE